MEKGGKKGGVRGATEGREGGETREGIRQGGIFMKDWYNGINRLIDIIQVVLGLRVEQIDGETDRYKYIDR